MVINWPIPKYHAYLTCQIVIQNKYILCNNFKQGVGLGVQQTFSTCALINIQMSIWFRLEYIYFEIISHSLEFLWIHIHIYIHTCMKVNILAAWQIPVSVWALIGWLQVWGCLGHSSHGFFLLSPPFQTQQISTGCRTMCPTDLQHFCCKALLKKWKSKPSFCTYFKIMCGRETIVEYFTTKIIVTLEQNKL